MRPTQWIKNLLLMAALIFSKNVFHPPMLLASVKALVIFCVLSSGVYLFNDLVDIEKDRIHPRKALRPLPSGRLDPSLAKAVCLGLLLFSVAASFFINRAFAAVCLGYLALQIAYSIRVQREGHPGSVFDRCRFLSPGDRRRQGHRRFPSQPGSCSVPSFFPSFWPWGKGDTSWSCWAKRRRITGASSATMTSLFWIK